MLIRGPEFRIRLEWHPAGIERWGLGSTVLSVGLPIGTPTGPRDLRGLDFFENMLPEGPALERMAALARVRPVDTYGILAAFGGQADIRRVTAANLIDEAVIWGIRRRTASAVVTETLNQVLVAVTATPGDARVLAAIREQTERISQG
jgi:hypothetical protein